MNQRGVIRTRRAAVPAWLAVMVAAIMVLPTLQASGGGFVLDVDVNDIVINGNTFSFEYETWGWSGLRFTNLTAVPFPVTLEVNFSGGVESVLVREWEAGGMVVETNHLGNLPGGLNTTVLLGISEPDPIPVLRYQASNGLKVSVRLYNTTSVPEGGLTILSKTTVETPNGFISDFYFPADKAYNVTISDVSFGNTLTFMGVVEETIVRYNTISSGEEKTFFIRSSGVSGLNLLRFSSLELTSFKAVVEPSNGYDGSSVIPPNPRPFDTINGQDIKYDVRIGDELFEGANGKTYSEIMDAVRNGQRVRGKTTTTVDIALDNIDGYTNGKIRINQNQHGKTVLNVGFENAGGELVQINVNRHKFNNPVSDYIDPKLKVTGEDVHVNLIHDGITSGENPHILLTDLAPGNQQFNIVDIFDDFTGIQSS